MGDKKRLFLAVNLSVAVTRKISDAAARMRQAAERRGLRVTWVAPANLHITLKFLGWTAAEAPAAIKDRMAAALATRRPLELAARGVGAYPSEREARVLWAGVQDPSGGLAQLAAIAEEQMAALGYAREARPFSGHVTLGRVKEGRGADEVLAPWKQTDFGSSTVRDVVLYESIMSSRGSQYTPLARMGFGDIAPGSPTKEGQGAERPLQCQTPEVEVEDQESEDASHGGKP